MNRVEKLLQANASQIAARRGALAEIRPGATVYFAGICGTGMAAAAALLAQLGFRITGSDRAFYPPMGDLVKDFAHQVYEGYSASNLDQRPDFVVIGNSLSVDHPEVQRVIKDKIPYASMPEVLGHFLVGDRKDCANSVVLAGTHGKTTSSAAMAVLLESAGRSPGYFVGGFVDNLSGNVRPVSAEFSSERRVAVLEGDEYDSAFFAKWSKFHSYRPDYLIITSLEFDHADIFSSIQDIVDEFEAVVRSMPRGSSLLLCDKSKLLKELGLAWSKDSLIKAKVFFYGENSSSEFRLCSREPDSEGQNLLFELEEQKLELKTSLSGEYNALNLLAVSAVAKLLGLSPQEISNGVQAFQGVRRRQEKVFEDEQLLVIEDFAHHPTAVQLTLSGLKEVWPERRIIAVFEPRSNTSQRDYFQETYAQSFFAAEKVLIKAVAGDRGYSKSGVKAEPLDTEKLVKEIEASGTDAICLETVDSILEELESVRQVGDLIVIMSNGDFAGLKDRLLQSLAISKHKP